MRYVLAGAALAYITIRVLDVVERRAAFQRTLNQILDLPTR